jgi:hypothetical protein
MDKKPRDSTRLTQYFLVNKGYKKEKAYESELLHIEERDTEKETEHGVFRV